MGLFNNKFYIGFAETTFGLLHKNMHINKSDLPENFTVTYHTGALNTKPNSINSVNTALLHGAEIVEIDVTFRPDGTPVIVHDSSPGLNQGVLFEDALKAVAQSKTCKINLDIKSTANLGAVDKLVNKYGLTERVFYTGVFEDFVNAVQNNSQIPYYLNYNISEAEANNLHDLQNIAEKIKNYGAIGINSNYTYATDLFVETMKNNGLLVSLWTVNKTDDMIKTLRLKPDNITTKKPHILKKIIK